MISSLTYRVRASWMDCGKGLVFTFYLTFEAAVTELGIQGGLIYQAVGSVHCADPN
ncbi:hypothetical protein BJY04DRAFT_190494 [Aspergillus karnatakaensis]|uniref:uncharacterized protein n=1 Tax=Aspergillus karnatakaensis TaxID=1810916 RepID=UPI003CCD9DC6